MAQQLESNAAANAEEQQLNQIEQNKETEEQQPKSWVYGLFSCLEDVNLCCYVAFCPTCAINNVHENLGGMEEIGCFDYQKAYCSCHLCFLTMKVRETRGYEPNCFSDFCSTLCCAGCQLARILQESEAHASEQKAIAASSDETKLSEE